MTQTAVSLDMRSLHKTSGQSEALQGFFHPAGRAPDASWPVGLLQKRLPAPDIPRFVLEDACVSFRFRRIETGFDGGTPDQWSILHRQYRRFERYGFGSDDNCCLRQTSFECSGRNDRPVRGAAMSDHLLELLRRATRAALGKRYQVKRQSDKKKSIAPRASIYFRKKREIQQQSNKSKMLFCCFSSLNLT